MNITGMEVYAVEAPLEKPFWPSWLPDYPQTHNRMTLVKIKTSDPGVEGITAAPAMGAEMAGLKGLILPFLMGRDPFNVEEAVKVLRNATYLGWRLWFLEIALWDIIGKTANLPVYKLLGGHSAKVPAYASTGEVRGADRRVKDALALKDLGFKAIKLRFHSKKIEKDLDVLKAVRDAVGGDMDIMVDANQGWKVCGLGEFGVWDFKTAVRMARAMEPLKVRWLEEPLGKNDYKGLAALRRETSTPIAGGEMNQDLHEFRDLIEGGCLDVVQPDCVLSGGILNSIKVAGMAQARDLSVSPHTWTNGVGLAANLQVMGAVGNGLYCEYPIEPPGWTPEARDFILKAPIGVDAAGNVAVPSSPGLGVEIDEDALAKYGRRLD